MQVIDQVTAADIILRQATRGKFFTVRFRKRGDGKMRTLTGRLGVKPQNERSETRPYDAADKCLITVWEPRSAHGRRDDGYRNIPVEGITYLAVDGDRFSVVEPDWDDIQQKQM